MKLKKSISYLVLMLACCKGVHSQAPATTGNTNSSFGAISYYTPPTPAMAALQKYGDLPVNYNTGIPDIKVPLGQITLRDFNWPVFLSYHAGGNKVGEFASSVGLGWTLQAGGFVSLKSFGGSSNHIYYPLNLNNIGEHNYNTTCESPLYNNENDVAKAIYAIQTGDIYKPDLYYVNTPVVNAKVVEGMTIPASDTKFILNQAGITVIDSKGNKYTFGRMVQSLTAGPCNTSGANGVTPTYALTKVKTYIGDSLIFTYDTIHYSYKGIPMEVRQRQVTGQCQRCMTTEVQLKNYECPSIHKVEEFVLRSIISSNGQKVTFDYGTRSDKAELKALTSVSFFETIKNNYQLSYKHILNQDYFGQSSSQNLRLKLSGVQKIVSGQSPERYTFDYDATLLPAIDSRGVDIAGYYNGASGSISSLASNGNRVPTLMYTKASVLTGIAYPTGGHTIFTYELNPGRWGGLRIGKIVDQGIDGDITKQRTYTYVGGEEQIDMHVLFEKYDYTFFLGMYPTGYHNPDVVYDLDELIPCAVITEQSVPITRDINDILSNLNEVSYTEVTEYLDDYSQQNTQGDFGKTVYRYNNHLNDNNRFYLAPMPALLTEKNTYKKDGANFTLLKSEEYDYEIAKDSIYSHGDFNQSTFWHQPQNIREGRVWIKTLEQLRDCILQPGSTWVTYTWPKLFSQLDFYMDIVPVYLKKSIVQDYRSGTTLITETNYAYDVMQGVLDASKLTNTQSNGRTQIVETKYTNSDLSSLTYPTAGLTAVQQANSDNVIIPVWKRVSVNNQPVFEDKIIYNINNNKVLASSEITKPTGSAATKTLRIEQYDGSNNPLQINTDNLKTTAYRYNSKNELTAACTNSSYADFAFTSFDDHVGSGFSYLSSGIITQNYYASAAAYDLARGNITFNCQDQNRTYVISGFAKGIVPSVTGALVASMIKSSTLVNGWYHFEAKITPTAATIAITGSALIDELRLYPTNAQVKTYAYGGPLNRISSVTDERGSSLFYSYTPDGKLTNIKDQDGKVLKHYDYHYQNQ